MVGNKLKEIGEKVRSVRKNQYKNYEDFAKANNFNKVTISRLEQGENVTLKTLVEVLNALGVSVNDFFKNL
jgi:transcriptional regulator with XRE-family HTH domain